MAQNLLWESQTRAQLPVWIPSPQGDGLTIYVGHMEYDLATTIFIWPLTQPFTCKIVSSIFNAMSRLKLTNMTMYSLPSMPTTERTNGEKCFCCSWKCLPCLCLFYFSQQSRRISIGSFLRVSHSIPPIWRQVWPQYDFRISHRWGRHLSSSVRTFPGVPPPMICCGPGGLGVIRVRS